MKLTAETLEGFNIEEMNPEALFPPVKYRIIKDEQ